ncbi:PREDICTED: protein C3orf33 homolog [Propithecus coquereli]|uniref:protein C3orf33 homolog n=1 Tax=Propithecus coquereli TaxID=379532 RepID=UPI00063F3DF1|nr:PREDICTED: protein C3orf33 homolog [Propithecus coquereli]
MAGRPVASDSQSPDPDRGAPNVVARISQWADDHLRLVRNISTGMAIAGIMLFIRSVRLTSKFTSSSDIPVEFIRRNVKLRGRLRRITENGLEIEHIPITLPIISSLRMLPKTQHLATRPDQKNEDKWFEEEGKRHFITLQGGYFSASLNEEILRRGLGKTVLVKGLNYDSKIYWTIHRNLLKAELTALKKREGIWKEESEKENYLEKLKDSWREIWTKDSYLKTTGSDLNLKKESYYDKLRRTYEIWKDNMNNYSLILKFRELISRIHFRRKE